MSAIEPEDVDAYLRRLRLEREPPSVQGLFRLHRAQVERVPYETTWIHMGERWDVDPHASARRIAHEGRGGYCFHLNGAFSELLRALGYQVTRHVGGVHGPDGPSEAVMRNHLVLTVAALPTDTNHSGDWYVDVGLGDALYEPVPLTPGVEQQGPFRLELSPQGPTDIGDWRLTHDPRGSFAGMAFWKRPTDIGEFAERNVVLSTSPDSGFVKLMTVQRRDASGVDILRGLVVRRIDVDESAGKDWAIRGEREFFDVLGDVFDLPLTGIDDASRDRLWRRVRDSHEAWLASQDQERASS